jgi:hypothetical protein
VRLKQGNRDWHTPDDLCMYIAYVCSRVGGKKCMYVCNWRINVTPWIQERNCYQVTEFDFVTRQVDNSKTDTTEINRLSFKKRGFL